MAPLILPAHLAAAVDRNDSPVQRAWIARLPVQVRELAERWALTVDGPYQPGGETSWVAPARSAGGRDLVLKVGWRHVETEHEADGLRAWHNRGAVLVHDVHVDGPTSALLLERCVPGTPLHALDEPEQDRVIARVLRRLWCEPPAGHPFRPLETLCDAWAEEFVDDLADEPGALDPGLARAGMELFRGLARDAGPRVLLATDVHAGNVLAAQREPWLLIDPNPYVGDPTYDVLQHLLNCPDRLRTDPHALAYRMAALLDLDAARVMLWLFARCVQESVQQPWLREVASMLAPR